VTVLTNPCLTNSHVTTLLAANPSCCSWPAVWNLIEQRGRIPSHIFLDYALTYLVLGTAVALTLGQLGPATAESPAFLQQLSQQNGRMVAFALAGGFFLAFGVRSKSNLSHSVVFSDLSSVYHMSVEGICAHLLASVCFTVRSYQFLSWVDAVLNWDGSKHLSY
jgi:hypothetical protein